MRHWLLVMQIEFINQQVTEFYKPFCRYVELWHRFYDDDTIPPCVLEEVTIDEKGFIAILGKQDAFNF